jgi:hypothetical protein
MAPNKRVTRSSKTGRFVVGMARYEKISAVEGIRLSADMKKRAEEFDRQRLTPEERRRAIVKAHRK